MKSRRGGTGFTLLELMIVVVVLGILASIAVPQYLKTVEKAHISEALSLLGQMRSAEVRYYAEFMTYTSNVNALDFSPTDITGIASYTYNVSSASATDFCVAAQRTGLSGTPAGCISNVYAVRINRNGNRFGTDCQTTSTGCP